MITMQSPPWPPPLRTQDSHEHRRNHPQLTVCKKACRKGDIEKRTGLLRCYLSRVENGHTIPSLDTLSKIATAMEVPLAQFFGGTHENGGKAMPHLGEDEVRFLTQIRRYSPNLNESDRKLVVAMVKKMAASAGK